MFSCPTFSADRSNCRPLWCYPNGRWRIAGKRQYVTRQASLQARRKLPLLRFALRERELQFVIKLRRALLEFWAVLMMALIVGFLGPFGTYLDGDFPLRVWQWFRLLLGAYLLVRPAMLGWRWLARVTGLPTGSMMFWGVMVSSAPMAIFWRASAPHEVRLVGGYTGLLPFSLLCSLAVIGVAWWAERADAHLRFYDRGGDAAQQLHNRRVMPAPDAAIAALSSRPPLYARLSPRFEGEIIALESEDHYVRVHGKKHNELLLLRLRDAIAEMGGIPGEQTHRSWWVARSGVAETISVGRNWQVRLIDGTRVPVARDSIERLRAKGFLPD